MSTIFANIMIRERTHMDSEIDPEDRFVRVVDMDGRTKKGFRTYDAALFDAIKILASYSGP